MTTTQMQEALRRLDPKARFTEHSRAGGLSFVIVEGPGYSFSASTREKAVAGLSFRLQPSQVAGVVHRENGGIPW